MILAEQSLVTPKNVRDVRRALLLRYPDDSPTCRARRLRRVLERLEHVGS